MDPPLRMAGAWEVGLLEFQYPNTWFNLTKATKVTVITLRKPKATKQPKPKGIRLMLETFDMLSNFSFDAANRFNNVDLIDELEVYLPAGTYASAMEILQKLVQVIADGIEARDKEKKRTGNPIYIIEAGFNKIEHKVKLKQLRPTMLFTDDAGGHFEALGFEPDKFLPIDLNNVAWQTYYKDLKCFIIPKTTIKSTKLIKNPPFYIYCSAVAFHSVGHVQAPLLRAVCSDGNYGEMTSVKFDNPYYFPTKGGDIADIEVEIRNSKGALVPFLYGVTMVTLTFRKRGLDSI